MTATPLTLATPLRLGPITLRNRVVKAATYETRGKDGLVTDELVAWHREFAAGGVGLTTLAYCAVSADGRTFADQLWMRPDAVPGLRRFTDAVHAEGAAAAIQLGHAGWFADPRATRTTPVGPSRQFSRHAWGWSRPMTADDFRRLTEDFAAAARLAIEAGFDALEIHLGHGYLLSQFLSPYNNRRQDAYGGPIAHRARFPREVLRAVREAADGRVAIWAKLNMEDGFRGGLVLDDSLQVARWLAADGTVDALELTGGHTTNSPMYLMRGDSPLPSLFAREPHPVKRFILKTVAPHFFKVWPYEEAWFLGQARRFLADVSLPLILLGGVDRRDTIEAALAEGFAAVALGRALIRRPDLVRQYAAGTLTASGCTHCNECVAAVGYAPTVCHLRAAS